MIDEYSISLGMIIGAAMIGTFFYGRQIGEARRDTEIARMNRACVQFDRYYADGDVDEPIAPSPSLSELAAFQKR